MKILGIDPGIERLGWALIEEREGAICYHSSGVKKTSSKKITSARLWELSKFVESLLKKESPERAGIEKLFFASNAKTALTIGEVRGVILATLEKHRVPIREFSPPEVKKLVTGDGRADKKQVAQMLSLILQMPKRVMLDDETDAIAIAIATLLGKEAPKSATSGSGAPT